MQGSPVNLVILADAARHYSLVDGLECLAAAVGSELTCDLRPVCEDAEAKVLLMRDFCRGLESTEHQGIQYFVETYLEYLIGHFATYEHIDFDLCAFADWLTEVLHDGGFRKEANVETSLAVRAGITSLQRISTPETTWARLALAPFSYIENPAIWPPEAADGLVGFIESIIDSGGATLLNIRRSLECRGIHVTPGIVGLLCGASPRLLCLRGPRLRVVKIDDALPRARLLSQCLSRRQIRLASRGDPVGRARLTRQLALGSTYEIASLGTRERDVIDPEELVTKVEVLSREPAVEEQGIPKALHTAICDLLTQAGAAMTYEALRKRLFVEELPLSPENLPPGRLMAYGRHPRFATKHEATYVLRDWVADETRTRGRIHRQRIITPFEWKSTAFSEPLASETVESLESFQQFGIVNLEILAHEVASRLPGRPIELYYTTQIR